MKRLALFLFLTTLFSVFAEEYIDVVKTKDDNIFKGIIIENKINEYIRIELPGGSIFKVEYSNIDSILKEKVQTTTTQPTQNQPSQQIIIQQSQNQQQQAQQTVQPAPTTTPSTATPPIVFSLVQAFFPTPIINFMELITP